MIGDCDLSLFGGPCVIVTGVNTGQCDLSLFGGPFVVTLPDPQTLVASAIDSAEAFGTAKLNLTLVPSGIASE